MRTYYIDIHYACFGIVIKDNIIIDTAPIAKWMLGKTTTEVSKWLKSKNAKIIRL